MIPKHQDPAGDPHSKADEGEFIVPVSAAPSAFVDTTDYVVQLETPQDSEDPEEAPVPAEADVEATESPQTLRKAA